MKTEISQETQICIEMLDAYIKLSEYINKVEDMECWDVPEKDYKERVATHLRGLEEVINETLFRQMCMSHKNENGVITI